MPQRITYTASLMKYMSLFESITGTQPKDVIEDSKTGALLFLVQQGMAGKAVGRKGFNIQRLEQIIKKKVRVAEFDEDIGKFIKNLIYPLQIIDATADDGIIIIKCPDMKTRALVIGREKANLNHLKGIISRYFEITEIKVA